MLAVLEDALATILTSVDSNEGKACRAYEKALNWCRADEPSWPFSFVNVCDALELDANRVRGWLCAHAASRQRIPFGQ
jgi:hypothetical protein